MPVREGKDSKGNYFRWGHEKKYYFKKGNKISEGLAHAKAERQGRAIRASGYK